MTHADWQIFMVNKIKHQATLPSLPIGVLEVLIFCGAFLVCGTIALNSSITAMILPMLLFTSVMMVSMVLSGVYKADIARSIILLHKRTAAGYLCAALMMLVLTGLSTSEFFDFKFIALAFIFSFIVISTIRPVISDDVTSGQGDRRSSGKSS